jgi:UMF1 family MFS transporter
LNKQWKRILAWSFYDFGNSAFATTVIAGFFPIFFNVTESTFKLGLANSLSGILVVIFAPVLGAMADRGGARKRFLAAFAAMGSAMAIALFFVGQGNWVLAAAFSWRRPFSSRGRLVFQGETHSTIPSSWM